MSNYRHETYTIGNVHKYTEQFLQKQKTWFGDELPADSVRLDGLLVDPKCAELVNALRVKAPELKIGAVSECRSANQILDDVAIYVDGEPYARGRVGYGDVGVNKRDDKYYLVSRNSKRARGGWGRWTRWAKAAKDLKVIVRAVPNELTPYSAEEVASLTINEFTYTMRQERSEALGNVRVAWSTLMNGDDVRDELVAMVKAGYDFRNHKITMNIRDYIAKAGVQAEVVAKRLDAYFLSIQGEDAHMTEYANMTESNKAMANTKINVSDIPFDMQLRIASLQVAEPMKYIEGLGMRVSDTVFWVQK